VPASAQDYNSNTFADAADYTVWQDNLTASVAPFAGADGDGSGVVDFADYAVWYNSFSTSPLSPSQTGGPTLSIVDLGLDVSFNRVWSVRIDPDDTLFTDPPDSPDRGVGGSVAAEIAFEVVTGTLLSVSTNAVDFSLDNPGNSPFGFNSSPDYGVSTFGNQIFAALGSEYFGSFNYGATAGGPHEMLRITTLGARKTKIMWSGVYGPNGDQGRLAQAGINFDTAGMAMAGVPEPGSLALVAIGVMGLVACRRCRPWQGNDCIVRNRLLALITLLLAATSSANAATIVSTLGSTPHPNSASSILGNVFSAAEFTTDGNSYQFTKALALISMDAPAVVNAALHYDNAGLPGAVAVALNSPSLPAGMQLATFTPVSSFTLTANTTYHLALNSPTSTFAGWKEASPFVASGPGIAPLERETRTLVQPWTNQAGADQGLIYEIQGVVPEPTSMAFIPWAVAACHLVRRRRQSNQRPA
jgi:hypothetical protein